MLSVHFKVQKTQMHKQEFKAGGRGLSYCLFRVHHRYCSLYKGAQKHKRLQSKYMFSLWNLLLASEGSMLTTTCFVVTFGTVVCLPEVLPLDSDLHRGPRATVLNKSLFRIFLPSMNFKMFSSWSWCNVNLVSSSVQKCVLLLDLSIGNIRCMLHVIENIQKNKLQAVLLSLHAENAFDRVSWEFLYSVLGKFKFHWTFIKTIKNLYNNAKARVKINGEVSNLLGLERGTRQGCPLSPLLFAIFVEVLNQGITRDKNITGITMFDQEHKMSLFADNVLLYLSHPENSILKLLSFLNAFSSVQGYS